MKRLQNGIMNKMKLLDADFKLGNYKLSILENSSSGAFGTYADVAAVISSPLHHWTPLK